MARARSRRSRSPAGSTVPDAGDHAVPDSSIIEAHAPGRAAHHRGRSAPADVVRAASPDQPRLTGGGTFDPLEAPISFVVCSIGNLERAEQLATHVLIALNEINGPKDLERLERLLDTGRHKVLLDSGIHSINTAYRRDHPEHQGSTFLIQPEDMPGFRELRDRYVAVASKYADRLWGYVELDQGGIEGKPRTRRALEVEGLAPIPVYHPLVDPPGYFDELAEGYDRICLGNLAFQPSFVRKRLLLTVFERRRRYPNLWIHALGITPNQWLRAMPVESCDSSTWTEPLRWGIFHDTANGQTLGQLPKNYMYRFGSDPADPDGLTKAGEIAMAQAHMGQRQWRVAHQDRLVS